jgi:hypothetical protein
MPSGVPPRAFAGGVQPEPTDPYNVVALLVISQLAVRVQVKHGSRHDELAESV